MKVHSDSDRALYRRRNNPPDGEEQTVTDEIYAVARALRELRPANNAEAKREENTVTVQQVLTHHRAGMHKVMESI